MTPSTNGDLKLNREQFLDLMGKLDSKERDIKIADMIYSIFESINNVKEEYRKVEDCDSIMKPEMCLQRHSVVEDLKHKQEDAKTKQRITNLDFWIKIIVLITTSQGLLVWAMKLLGVFGK